MAQRKTQAWKELRVGLLVIVSFVLLAVAIFFIGGDSGFFTPKYSVTAYFQSANGLHAGAAVLLDGVTVGNVASVKLAKLAEPNRTVEVSLRLDKSFQHMIHSDALVSIGTVGLLGDQQIELTRGSQDKPAVEDGGTIQGNEAGDIKKIISGTNDLVANLGQLSTTMGDLTNKVDRGEGTLGKMLTDPSIYNRVDATIAEANALVKDAHTGNGTIGRLMTDDELYRNLKGSIDHLDKSITKIDGIIAKVDRGEGTLGKFINDPSLYNNANRLIAQGNSMLDRIDRGEGTLGKLSKDDALYNDMRTTLSKTNSLLSSVENGEGTLGKLVKDSTLYNSLTQTSSELQKLMYDFRQNPKKYLTINFRLF